MADIIIPDTKALLNPDFVGLKLAKELQEAFEATEIARVDYPEAFRLRQAFHNYANLHNPALPVTVTYISDNGGYADTAGTEIEGRLSDINAIITRLSGKVAPETIYRDIPAQDWRAGAFDIAQRARDTVRGTGNVLFLNCAPRLEERGQAAENGGESIYVGILPNGMVVAATSPGSFAHFRDLVESGDLEIYRANVQNNGTQFRSRDIFPWYSQLLAHNLANNVTGWRHGLDVEQRKAVLQQLNFISTDKKIGIEKIYNPAMRAEISRTDTHGNLKLSIRKSDLSDEQRNSPVKIIINGHELECALGKNMFDKGCDSVSVSEGSSGRWDGQSAFIEIAHIGHNLRHELGITDEQLKSGVSVQIVPLEEGHEVVPFRPAQTVTAAPQYAQNTNG